MDPLARDLFRPSNGNPLPSAGSKKKYPTAVALGGPGKGEEERKTQQEREKRGEGKKKTKSLVQTFFCQIILFTLLWMFMNADYFFFIDPR